MVAVAWQQRRAAVSLTSRFLHDWLCSRIFDACSSSDLLQIWENFSLHWVIMEIWPPTPISSIVERFFFCLMGTSQDTQRITQWFLSESFMPDAKDDWLVKGDLLHQQKITTLVQSQKCRFQLNPPRMRIATERHHHALWTYLSSSRSFPPFIRLIFVSQKHP